MRRIAFVTTLLALVLALSPIHAISVSASFNAGNMFYGTKRSATDQSLPADTYLFGGAASLTADLTEDLSLRVGLERDHVLRNYAYLRFAHAGPIATIAVGPVLGAINDLSRWYYVTPGIFSLVRVELGTLGYVSFSSISSGFLALDDVGDSNQSSYTAEVGFYGNGINTSLYLDNRAYTTLTDSGRSEDSATEYGLRMEAFKKNISYRIVLDFSYASLKRRYVVGDTATVHNLGTVLFTPRVELDLGSSVTVGVGAENGLYTFGLDYLLGEFDATKYFFDAVVDVTLTI